MRSYLISGLVVSSDLELLFADVAGATRTDIDVVVRRDDIPPTLDAATASGPCWSTDGRRCLLIVPGVVRCLVADGREITWEPEAGVDPADVTPFVMGTGFGVLLHQRGLMVLHASSVVVAGKAVLFCGPSGAGKSTIVAALGQRGFPFVSDDICIVDFDSEGNPVARPDGRLIRLWGRVVREFSLADRQLAAVRPSIAKYYVAPASQASSYCAVGAIYRLRPVRPSQPPRITRANAGQAALSLRGCTYRPRYVTATGQQQRLFEHVTRMASHVGVFDFWRPLDFNALPGTLDDLAAHWRAIGLTETTT